MPGAQASLGCVQVATRRRAPHVLRRLRRLASASRRPRPRGASARAACLYYSAVGQRTPRIAYNTYFYLYYYLLCIVYCVTLTVGVNL